MHYHVVVNVSGYLPESDEPGVFMSFEDAQHALAGDIGRVADGFCDGDQGTAEDETRIQGHLDELGRLVSELKALPADHAGGWLEYAATHPLSDHDIPTAYQIVECSDTECVVASDGTV